MVCTFMCWHSAYNVSWLACFSACWLLFHWMKRYPLLAANSFLATSTLCHRSCNLFCTQFLFLSAIGSSICIIANAHNCHNASVCRIMDWEIWSWNAVHKLNECLSLPVTRWWCTKVSTLRCRGVIGSASATRASCAALHSWPTTCQHFLFHTHVRFY